MVEVQKMLVLSTAHISRETALYLDNYQSIGYSKDEYGWFIPITDVDTQYRNGWPDDLWAIRKFAIAHGCSWIMLDRDADTIDGLETWDW